MAKSSTVLPAKGGGFGSNAQNKPKKVTKDSAMKKVLKTYGGSSPADIARATQMRVEEAFQKLPTHMRMAAELYEQIKKWGSYVSRLSILEETNIPGQELQAVQRAKEELSRLMKDHEITENDIHNVFQKATWDASADAKAARSVTGAMPIETAKRVDRACAVLADVLQGNGTRCLDVGCGFGVLVPHLLKAGIKRKQIYGVDLSTEMIRNAQELHPGVNFQVTDFLNEYEDDSRFDGIIFCASLHDLPDPIVALKKAAALLKVPGIIVIVHPQGGIHVRNQLWSNPVLVKRGLPSAHELVEIDHGLQLVIEPADAGSIRDNNEGYLAVLQKAK
jgi:SAM-dependent methyltransferase